MMYDWDEYDEIDLFSFDFPRRRPRKERKDPNWCQYNDCQEDKEKSRDYCVNHNWECLTNNCENRIRYEKFGSSFCSEHKYLCQTEYCKQRIDSSYSYCSEHEIKYYCQECRVRIGTGESYCSQHKDWKYCLAKNKICRINGKIFSIRDWSSHHGGFFGYPSYDEEENCSNKIFNSEMFCWKHQNQCLEQYCARRLDGRNKYCYDHAPACQVLNPSGYYCLLKITSGDTYCSSHNKVCQVCSTRISDSNTYCYDHERTCSDCSSRIAYNRTSCYNCKDKRNCKANDCHERTSYSYCSYHEKCLSKLQEYKNISNIQEIETFDTWFNGNCGYVITKNTSASSEYPYRVWIVIYEPAVRSMSEKLVAIKYKSNYGSLSSASDKAKRIKTKLQNDNFDTTPMLYIHPEAKGYEKFRYIITSPYVEDNQVGTSETTNFGLFIGYNSLTPGDLDRYFKPLDIAWVENIEGFSGGKYYHVGIVLGNGYVCHFSRESNGVRVVKWDKFLGGSTRKIIRYHPMIPFKHPRKIIKQITWAVERIIIV